MEVEIKRQVIHAMGIFTIVLIYVFGRWYAGLLMLAASIGFLFLGEYRKNRKKYKLLNSKHLDEFEEIIEDEFKTYERKYELQFQGIISFCLGFFLVAVLFETYIVIASIAVLAMADSLSTLVGYFFGKHKLPINKKKSWEGSITFLLASLGVLLLFVDPVKALIIAGIVTFVEMLPKTEDNITVPLATGLLMLFL